MKSKGTGVGRASALLINCESWYRFQEVGIMNFWVGRGYGVDVVKMTAWEAGEDGTSAGGGEAMVDS